MNFRGEKLFDASFDKFAKTYDEVRPRYPIQLYKDIQSFCGISSQTNLLEIGTGSGIATEEITKFKIGEVKVDGKRWSAISDEKIKVGETVMIDGIDGVKLIVRKGEK